MSYTPPNPNGQATMANSSPVVIASNQSSITTKFGLSVGTIGLSALNADNTATLTSGEIVLFEITGTWTGTIVFEASLDDSTYYALEAINVTTKALVTSVVNNAQNGIYIPIRSKNIQYIRARMSAYTSGTASVTASQGIGNSDIIISNGSGTAAINIQDGGNSITVDNGGTFAVQDSEKVTDNAAFTDGTTKVLPVGFIFDETAGTALTENDAAAARVDSKRSQVIVIEDATTRGQRLGVSSAGAASVNNTQIGGNTISTGNGTVGTGVQRVAVASDNTPFSVYIAPNTTGGLNTYHLSSAATTNATVIKASAGQVFGWYIYNNNAAARKVAFHNASSTPTAGASIFFTLIIPPNSGANVFNTVGITFSTGISITTVTGVADSNATAVAADDLNINIFYE